MKVLLLVAFAFGLASLESIADDHPLLKPDPACSVAPTDPFEPSLTFAKGINQGKCANTGEMRSIQFLTDDQAKRYGLPSGKKYFANFRHDHKYWIASLDPADVQEVSMVTESFPAAIPAAHTMLRFKFKPGKGIDLTEQSASLHPAHAQVHEFYTSDEAVVARGGAPYDIVTGQKENFGFAYRITSAKEKYDWIVASAHHKTSQVRLKLSDAEKTDLAREVLQQSNDGALDHVYNTLNFSCTTELFKSFDKVVKRPGLFRKMGIHAGATVGMQTYPVGAENAMWLRGVYYPGHESRMPSMDQDPTILSEVGEGSRSVAGDTQSASTHLNKAHSASRATSITPPTSKEEDGAN